MKRRKQVCLLLSWRELNQIEIFSWNQLYSTCSRHSVRANNETSKFKRYNRLWTVWKEIECLCYLKNWSHLQEFAGLKEDKKDSFKWVEQQSNFNRKFNFITEVNLTLNLLEWTGNLLSLLETYLSTKLITQKKENWREINTTK